MHSNDIRHRIAEALRECDVTDLEALRGQIDGLLIGADERESWMDLIDAAFEAIESIDN